MKYPDDFVNKIICGDCVEVMKDIPNNSVDLILTSPPYNKTGYRGHPDLSKGKGRWQNSNIIYGEFTDDLNEKEYKEQQVNFLNEAYRIIKPTGSILYNHKIRRANKRASSPMEWILKSRGIFYQEIIWNRMSGVDHNINYLDPVTERIYWLIKDNPKCNKDKKWATEIWNLNPIPEPYHPAPFPLKLCKVAIQLVTSIDDIVFDPFCGIGTACSAAKELNRNYIGIDISPEYCKIAERRLMNVIPDMFLTHSQPDKEER